ncbi:amino acid adenylation domain-containing protein [Amycolatopsis magusensis]|uniref:Amino acid adenylation domain-containing protein n=1 Tax=Amycolatopsis magusensis TaxID=882444 RepID=A0ABS4PVZ2_9PSEU|nr:amino acid adenylation domain-containing protein [Amycolatopsis magusensis]MBP2183586.1 amino acid adenylation domain-containing protein [Amycolatopsis magusensis]
MPFSELPDRRVHEIIAEQAARRPDAVTLSCGDTHWTYSELDGRANRAAAALLHHGLAAEDAVAVATERTPPWAAAVLGVFKAGGAYLPVEPGLPADRIAAMLTGAGVRLVVADGTGTGSVREAAERAGARVLDVGDITGDRWRGDDPGITVTADQLAYVFFTSGSTGTPKGAQCEHAGMLNHMLAKISDLGMTGTDALAQHAPQSFDVVLWQLFAALLLGGRTVLVPTEVVRDPERFVDVLVRQGVSVLQLVPSYLEILLGYLEARPRSLGPLRILSATGEALSKPLLARWFAAFPDIPVLNTYGLTELSDDVLHVVLRSLPEGDLVPIGHPIPNTRVHLVDSELREVPPGEAGQLAFSGVCVGRGYVNDPELNRKVLRDNPFGPGKLYLTGDFGRLPPSGEIEFIGRRDDQVKIRGMRLELGEIETHLRALPGVLSASVVTVTAPDQPGCLTGFVVGRTRLDHAHLRHRLSRVLPDYMVPDRLHQLDALPLTPNGKIDKRALATLATTLRKPVVWTR